MYEDVMGQVPEITTDFAVTFGALVDGQADIVVELPWEETFDDGLVERHQIVLHGLSEDQSRVLFFNPTGRRNLPVGAELGQHPRQGPPRRVEEEDLQSMELAALARFFAEGRAHALIPPPD